MSRYFTRAQNLTDRQHRQDGTKTAKYWNLVCFSVSFFCAAFLSFYCALENGMFVINKEINKIKKEKNKKNKKVTK